MKNGDVSVHSGVHKAVQKAVKRARLSEIQAIAIYESEVFWIRKPDRRALLAKILEEERSHNDELRPYGEISSIETRLSQTAGWILGTVLSSLPWSVLCKVQSWAEGEAAAIYDKAAVEIKMNGALNPEVIQKLEHARDQELEHARLFRVL